MNDQSKPATNEEEKEKVAIGIAPWPDKPTGELEELAQEWAADDRKWNTQNVVAINLIAFTNAALAAERSKRELAEFQWKEVSKQLAAAQVTIKQYGDYITELDRMAGIETE